MTTFSASVRGWSQKAKQSTEYVVRGAVQDVGELMTRRSPGTSDGGAHRVGFVPVVDGELIGSQQVSVNGGAIGSGEVSYAAMVAGLDLGDTFEAVFTAEHARPKEYGHGTAPGWFFVRNAVQQWQTIVDQNAAQFGD